MRAAHIDLPGNTFSMWGAWGISADLPSKRIVVSDRISGLFLFDFDQDLFETAAPSEALQVYPNPVDSGAKVVVRLPEVNASSFNIRVLSATGAIVHQMEIEDQTYIAFELPLAAGCYTIEAAYSNSNEGRDYRKKIVII